MRRSLAVLVLLLGSALVAAGCAPAPEMHPPSAGPAGTPGTQPGELVLTTGLTAPTALVLGPDNFLWVLDRKAGQIVRVSPASGTRTTALTIGDVATDGPDEGLLGLAFGAGGAFVAYTYNTPGGPRTKIVQYVLNPEAGLLTSPTGVIDNLPAGPRGNGGGLLVGPDQKLYYGLGDLGNNEGDRDCLPILSQALPTAPTVAARDWTDYQGKVLRLNLDGSIPADNPSFAGVRSHIYADGLRDPVALAPGPGGTTLIAEAGWRSDDEVDVLRAGGNYGWPFVAGRPDDAAYRYANWSAAPGCPSLTYDAAEAPPSVPRGQTETSWRNPGYVDPLATLFTVPNGFNFRDPACGVQFELCWPSVRPSGLAYLPGSGAVHSAATGAVPGNSLLLSSERNGSVYLLQLSQDGRSVPGRPQQLFHSNNLYRGVAVSADHGTVYVATDSAGTIRPRSPTQSGELDDPGAILSFRLDQATPSPADPPTADPAAGATPTEPDSTEQDSTEQDPADPGGSTTTERTPDGPGGGPDGSLLIPGEQVPGSDSAPESDRSAPPTEGSAPPS